MTSPVPRLCPKLFLVLCLAATALGGDPVMITDFEQGDSGFRWYDPGNTAQVSASGPPANHGGAKGVMVIVQKMADSNQAQLQTPELQLTNDSTWQLSFWAWADTSDATLTATFQDANGGWHQRNTWLLTSTWQQYTTSNFVPATAPAPFRLVFTFGSHVGKYCFDDFYLAGSTLDFAWTDPMIVQERIDTYRKGAFRVQFVAPNGSAVEESHVSNLQLVLRKHAFYFGAAWDPQEDMWGDDMDMYRDTAGQLFNSMAMDSAFAWSKFEPQQGNFTESRILVDEEYIQFAKEQWMSVRAGPLESFAPPETDLWAHAEGCETYNQSLYERVTRDVGYYRGKVFQYDVWAALFQYHDFLEECGFWTIDYLAKTFQWAAVADPNAKLCLNEYNLANSTAGNSDNLIANLVSQGTPISCLSVKAPVTTASGPAALLAYRLGKLANSTSLDLYITDFSIDPQQTSVTQAGSQTTVTMSEDDHANTFEQYMRLFFSHPAVKGVWLAGFWDGNVPVAQSGLYKDDWTPKKTAERYRWLLGEWNTTVMVDSPVLYDGWYYFEGYYGTYTFSVDVDGEGYIGSVELLEDGVEVLAQL